MRAPGARIPTEWGPRADPEGILILFSNPVISSYFSVLTSVQ